MSTFYLSILAAQSPANVGTDTNGRTLFSCNYDTVAHAPVEDFLGEMGALISVAGLGTKNTTMFIGREAKLPTGDGPYVTLNVPGGLPNLETHNGDGYERHRLQVVVTARVFSDAKAQADAIFRAIGRRWNETVTGLP